MPSFIFLVSSRKWDVAFCDVISRFQGAKVAISSGVEGLEGLVDSSAVISIFLDADSDALINEFVDRFSGVFPRHKIHALLGHENRPNAVELGSEQDIGNIVLRPMDLNEEQAAIDGILYSRVIDANRAWQTSTLASLLPRNSEIGAKEINDSLQKRFIVEAINNSLEKRNWLSKISSIIATAVDELIMNAIYDAPHDKSGQQIHAKLDRSTRLTLAGPEAVNIQIGYDNNYFAATVKDQFGTLSPSTLFKYSTRAFNEKLELNDNRESQGAGLGLSIILKSGGSIRLFSRPGVSTEMTVFFCKTDSTIRFRRQLQFISTFQVDAFAS